MYLKGYPISADAPDRWLVTEGGPGISFATHPTNDWKFLDLFTTALHPNATRGLHSVNQTNVAAWSAVLSGIRVTTMTDDGSGWFNPSEVNVEPAAVNSSLGAIIDAINRR